MIVWVSVHARCICSYSARPGVCCRDGLLVSAGNMQGNMQSHSCMCMRARVGTCVCVCYGCRHMGVCVLTCISVALSLARRCARARALSLARALWQIGAPSAGVS